MIPNVSLLEYKSTLSIRDNSLLKGTIRINNNVTSNTKSSKERGNQPFGVFFRVKRGGGVVKWFGESEQQHVTRERAETRERRGKEECLSTFTRDIS